jgi:hypothetical protein
VSLAPTGRSLLPRRPVEELLEHGRDVWGAWLSQSSVDSFMVLERSHGAVSLRAILDGVTVAEFTPRPGDPCPGFTAEREHG